MHEILKAIRHAKTNFSRTCPVTGLRIPELGHTAIPVAHEVAGYLFHREQNEIFIPVHTYKNHDANMDAEIQIQALGEQEHTIITRTVTHYRHVHPQTLAEEPSDVGEKLYEASEKYPFRSKVTLLTPEEIAREIINKNTI